MKIKKEKILIPIIKNIIKIFIIILFLYNLLYVLNHYLFNNNYVQFFKYAICVIKDNQMNPAIKKGDLVILKTNNKSNILEEDVVTYKQDNNIVISRVKIIRENSSGEELYTIKADSNYYYDNKERSNGTLQKVSYCRIPLLGYLLNLTESLIFTLFIIFVLLISIKFSKIQLSINKRRRIKKENKI